MVRISDIIKHRDATPEPNKEREEKKAAKEGLQEPAEKIEEKAPLEGIQISKAMAEEAEAEKEMRVAKAMREMQLDPEESHRIYNQALAVIRQILNTVQSDKPMDLSQAYEIVKIMVDRIVLGDKELISDTVNYSEDNYLYAHSVNVCIYSIDMGLAVGYNKSKLNEMGAGALLHDLGMMKHIDIAKEPHKLNAREYAEIKKHPTDGNNTLKKIKDIQEEVIYIVKQHQERLNGEGYPEGLKDDQIDEYAQIVSIVDVYEALTHPRNYREAFNPHEAIKELLDMSNGGLFKLQLIKLLINRIGLYPIGSWLELNTGEIAKVISTNEDTPLRPKVNIVFGLDKKKLPHIKPLNLYQHANIFIKRSINPKELDLNLE